MISVNHLSRHYRVPMSASGGQGVLGLIGRGPSRQVRAVDDVSFEIGAGQIVGFIGPNGAGKTTTLKMLAGLLTPTSGDVRVLNHLPFQRSTEFRRQISLVMGQKTQLWWDLPPIETFRLNRAVYDIPMAEYAQILDEMVTLLDVGAVLDTQVRRLSLGERMKCELIAALLHRPRVLFLDEPTIGLDVVAQRRLRDFCRSYNQRYGTTILLTSHDMDDVEQLCARILIITQGRLIFDGDIDTLLTRYGNDKYLTIVFAERQQVVEDELARFGRLVDYDGGAKATLAVPRAEHSSIAAALLARYEVSDLVLANPALEEIIARVFRTSTRDGEMAT